ncbi:unnamed protein product [Fusarium graminearum]|uniref:Chromosome 2, complete genome n=2 Tax=Gibberella zeae TaxID=5518 RepID=A0A098DJF6_GIBZE|nr:unnamed protein product [Fusarium graminearum]CZS81878.1 unnamed protein product [Fusarium graminearum]
MYVCLLDTCLHQRCDVSEDSTWTPLPYETVLQNGRLKQGSLSSNYTLQITMYSAPV